MRRRYLKQSHRSLLYNVNNASTEVVRLRSCGRIDLFVSLRWDNFLLIGPGHSGMISISVKDECFHWRPTKYWTTWEKVLQITHREHTILLCRKRVNKEMKRMNILPLTSVASCCWSYMRPYRENRYLHEVWNSVALNSYLHCRPFRTL